MHDMLLGMVINVPPQAKKDEILTGLKSVIRTHPWAVKLATHVYDMSLNTGGAMLDAANSTILDLETNISDLSLNSTTRLTRGDDAPHPTVDRYVNYLLETLKIENVFKPNSNKPGNGAMWVNNNSGVSNI